MKSITINLADDLASDMESMIREGYFRSEQDLLSVALQEFLRHHRPELEKRYQLEDIAWAERVAEDRRGGRADADRL
jgi:Arc/MetJ-type ribon-helix-helix transcriptional regulator